MLESLLIKVVTIVAKKERERRRRVSNRVLPKRVERKVKAYPMNPMDRPRTNNPLRVPIFMYSAASSGVKAPEDLSKSQNETAIAPSTFKIKAID